MNKTIRLLCLIIITAAAPSLAAADDGGPTQCSTICSTYCPSNIEIYCSSVGCPLGEGEEAEIGYCSTADCSTPFTYPVQYTFPNTISCGEGGDGLPD